MSRFKAVIFDYDGIISDSLDVKTEAFAEMYRPYGPEIERMVVEHHKNNGGVSRFEKFRIYHGEYLGQGIDEPKINELADRFSSLVLDKVVGADYVPGILEFISRYHAFYDFYISTGTPEVEIHQIADRKGIRKYFKEIYGSPEKKSAHVRHILEANNYDRSQVVFIGDAPTDRDAARDNGITFIGRYTTAEEIKSEKYLVKDFRNFNEYLKNL